MLRVLFIILAVVSVVLAFVLKQLILYVVAAGFLVATGALFVAQMKKRHRDVPEIYTQAPTVPDEDLSSLGIMDIKPKAAGGRSVATGMNPTAASPAQASSLEEDSLDGDELLTGDGSVGARHDDPLLEQRATSSMKARTKASRPRVMVSEASSTTFEEVLIPCLNSLRASVGAYTVCLLKQDDIPLRYHVEVMLSQNSYARASGSFSAKEPLLAGHRALVPVVYPRIGPNGFPKKKLSYYHEPINIRQVAMVPITPKKADQLFLLVLDTMNDGGLEAASVRVLLEQYARLISTLLDTSFEGELAAPPSKDTRSRREIIADEIERARTLSHPLSLAIVYLNRGEELAEHSPESMAVLESEFEARLRDIAVDARIERFGELTFGIFYHGAREGVATWAGRLRDAFEESEDDLGGGVSIGVAILQDRHEGAEDLRSDATAALREAFETGECTVVD